MYWSTNPTPRSEIVKQTMASNIFTKIKQYLHFRDNTNLDLNDKYIKTSTLFDLININFMNFGVLKEHMSIVEPMLPFYCLLNCKVFIKSKPIKFGYKAWCMAASTRYLYQIQPYSGSSDNYDKSIRLGVSVVPKMISHLEYPNRHKVFFDNFFTSQYLMCLLADKSICATGTVRSNRLGKLAPDICFAKR